MGLKSLAEGIIVQSMEDLWEDDLREDCVAFFRGEEFRTCAELADMSLNEQLKILDMVKVVLDRRSGKSTADSSGKDDRAGAYLKWRIKEFAPCR
jgi:hypothetical protein